MAQIHLKAPDPQFKWEIVALVTIIIIVYWFFKK